MTLSINIDLIFCKTTMYNRDMEISGPSFCPIRNGKPCNKYLIITRERNPKGVLNTLYFFTNQDDAEVYLRFLQQVEGRRFVDSVLHSTRTPLWEKKEFRDFEESIDWEELPAKIKKIEFTTETVFTEIRTQK